METSHSIIVISGLDGSGKSTQSRIIADRLNRSGIKAVTLWNRWEPKASYPFINLAKRYLSSSRKISEGNYRGFTDAKRQSMRSSWKKSLWQLTVWSEYLIEVLWRLHPYGKDTIVLFDRYYYDTMIDMAINFSYEPERLEELLNHRLIRLYPKPKATIFIDVKPEIGIARKKDGTPLEYLVDRRRYYTKMAEIVQAPVIDGNASIEDVATELWRIVSGVLGKTGDR